MSDLEIRLLGPFQVRVGGEAITEMRSDKVRAMLAYLAVEADQPHRREKLAGLLWPGYPEVSARASLRRALADLRTAIGDEEANPPYLEITRQTIQFVGASNAWVDVIAFSKLVRRTPSVDEKVIASWEKCVALYRGEFMEGFSLPDSPEYEQWLLQNREQVIRQVLETLGRLVDCLERRGEYQRGLEHAWRGVELEPLRESGQRGLMRLLALSGQREKALAQYKACGRELARELGVEPSVETRQLYEQILRGEWPQVAPVEAQLLTRQPRSIGACPYRGLATFREEDSRFFFGRERFTQQLLDALHARQIIAVIIGSSGSGKSSVVSAGVIPRLRAEGGWLVVNMRPGVSPFQSLSMALLPLFQAGLSEIDRLIESQKLSKALAEREITLAVVLDHTLELNPESRNLLLFIDQFEELFTLCPDAEVRQRFIDQLLGTENTGKISRTPYAILLTMRADFVGQALSFRPFADMLQTSSLMLGPMSREELRAAIEKPAEVRGAAFESGLVERILEDVSSEPGNLPLLEFALTQLWEKAQAGWLTHEAYESIGGVEGALARYAEQVYNRLDEAEREKARRILLQLVRPGEGTEDTRRVATRAEVGETNWSLVQYLADKRLVVTARSASGEETAEVVHEALIVNWERLREWIEADRAFRIWQERLRSTIRQWEATGEDEGALLRGAPLAEAETWVGTHNDKLSGKEVGFIKASVALCEQNAAEQESLRQRELDTAQQLASSERKRRRVALALAGVLSFAMLVALILTAYSLSQRNAAVQAYSASLAANAQQALEDGDTATALALAQAATAVDQPSLQAHRVLLDAAYSPGARQRFEISQLFPEEVGPASAIATGTDGKTAVVGLEDGTIILWDVERGEEINHFQGHSAKINDIEIAPDGRTAVSVGDDAQAIVWDIFAGRELQRFEGNSGLIRAVDVSLDGRLVVTGGYSELGWEQPGELILWELATGKEIRRFTGHIAGVVAAEFCLDDQAVLAGSGDMELLTSLGTESPQVGAARRDMLLWNVENEEITHNFEGMEHDAFAISVSPDGNQALVGSYYEGLISVYDLMTYENLATLEGHQDSVQTLTYGMDGRTAVSGAEDGNLILWDLLSYQPIAWLAVHTGEVLDIALSSDGRNALSSGRDGALILWDLKDAAEIRRFYGHGDMVYDVALLPMANQLLSGSGSGSVNRGSWDTSLRLWDTEAEHQLITTSISSPVIFQVAVSPDEQTALFVGVDPFIRVLDLKTLEEVASLQGHQLSVPCIEFLPDGNRALSCSGDNTLILWDLQSGQPIYRLEGRGGEQGLWAVTISPDGSTALSDTADGTMILWDLQRGVELRTFRTSDPSGWTGASGIAYLPGGKTAISVGGDGKIIQWDLESGEEIRRIGEHPSLRTRIVVTPDGKLAMTAGMDGRLMLWDLENGTLIRSSDGHGVIFDLTLGADGQTTFYGSSDTTIVQWLLSNPTLSELKDWIVANRYVRPLTCVERELYQVAPLCESP